MLDKDPSRRLGASKGTMFQLGGTVLLKKHAFFSGFTIIYTTLLYYFILFFFLFYFDEGMDWNAVFNKELLPPIDVQSTCDNDVTHFHEDFTGKAHILYDW